MVDKNSKQIICIAQGEGRKHDFRLFKESKTHVHEDIKTQADTGYQGMHKLHTNCELPKKRSKKNPLTEEDKMRNRKISSSRVLVENVIRCLKIFRVLAEKYRNRRKRFSLRLSLISAIYNFQL